MVTAHIVIKLEGFRFYYRVELLQVVEPLGGHQGMLVSILPSENGIIARPFLGAINKDFSSSIGAVRSENIYDIQILPEGSEPTPEDRELLGIMEVKLGLSIREGG